MGRLCGLNHTFICLLDTALNPMDTVNVSVTQQQSNSNLAQVCCSKGATLLKQVPESKIY